MLVYVRPSNEALLRARVPGAQDQHGYPLPILFTVRVLRARRAPGRFILPSFLVYFSPSQDGSDESPTARVQRGESATARCASTGDSPSHPSSFFERVKGSMLYSASPE
jgi:hypothetical protein